MDSEELARRSIAGFAETLTAFGATGVGGASAVRRPDAIGARVPWASDNNWIDTAVVPPGATASYERLGFATVATLRATVA
jgi:hypothetical protein